MGVVLHNPATGRPEYVEDENVQAALQQGYKAPDGGIQVQRPGFSTVERVGASELAGAGAAGAQPVNLNQIGRQAEAERERARFDTLGQEVLAFGEGALSGATLGLSDLLTEDYSTRMRRDVNPLVSGAGTVAGAVIPSLVSPGSALARAPSAYVARAAEAVGKAVVKELSEKAAGRLTTALVKGTQLAIEGGVDGAIWGAAQASTDALLDRRPFTGEVILSQALLGAGLGGLLGVAGGALRPGTIDSAAKATRKQVLEATATQRAEAITQISGRLRVGREFLESARVDVGNLGIPELGKLVDEAEAAEAAFLAAAGTKKLDRAEMKLAALMQRADPEAAIILAGKLDGYQQALKRVDDALEVYRPSELDKLQAAALLRSDEPAQIGQYDLAPVPDIAPLQAPGGPVAMAKARNPKEAAAFQKDPLKPLRGDGPLQRADLGGMPGVVEPLRPGATYARWDEPIVMDDGQVAYLKPGNWWDNNPNWKHEIERVAAGGELLPPERFPASPQELRALREARQKASGAASRADSATNAGSLKAKGGKGETPARPAPMVVPPDIEAAIASGQVARARAFRDHKLRPNMRAGGAQGGLVADLQDRKGLLPHPRREEIKALQLPPTKAKTPRIEHRQLHGAEGPSKIQGIDLPSMGRMVGIPEVPQMGPAADLFLKGWGTARMAKVAAGAERGPGVFGTVIAGAAGSKFGLPGYLLVSRALSMGMGRMASATGDALGRIRQGVAAMLRPAVTRQVTRGALALRAASYKDLDLGLGRPEDPQDDYGATIAQLARAVEQPALLEEAIADKFLGVQALAPDVAEVAIDRAKGIVRGILSKAPKPPGVLVRPEAWRPDETKQRAFLRYVSGALNPIDVMAAPGEASAEALEAVRDNWPEVYAVGQEELLKQADKLHTLGHQSALRVSQVLGVPMTQLADPGYVARQQELYLKSQDKSQAGPAQAQGGAPKGITITLPATTPTPGQAYAAPTPR